jgi:hypothetical protein
MYWIFKRKHINIQICINMNINCWNKPGIKKLVFIFWAPKDLFLEVHFVDFLAGPDMFTNLKFKL